MNTIAPLTERLKITRKKLQQVGYLLQVAKQDAAGHLDNRGERREI